MSWIDEKKRKLETNYKTGDESNLTEKIKLMQNRIIKLFRSVPCLGRSQDFVGGGGVLLFTSILSHLVLLFNQHVLIIS